MARSVWTDLIPPTSRPEIRHALEELYDGHQRFLNQKPTAATYTTDDLSEIATNQHPIAAIVACSDSRVAPEILFDQPLGQIFASRVPGNVASDSAKWMLEIAVTDLGVPLVVVMGHIGCLAVKQIVDGKVSSAGGNLRFDVQKAVHRARLTGTDDVARQSVIENVMLTIENLHRDSYAVQRAIEKGNLALVGAYYEMTTGAVHMIA